MFCVYDRRVRFAGLFSYFLFALVLGVFAFHDHADAQYTATAQVDRPIAAPVAEEPTLSASVVESDDRAKSLESVDELILEVPGTRLQRFGAYGSFTALSLRGAEFDHTTVLFGNIPLRSADGGAFDLSTIPLAVLERVEVYRGAAPAWLVNSGIGGVLQLLPREAHTSEVELGLGVGSFGLLDTHAATSVITPSGLRWTAVAGVTHSDNDFEYKDESGTHFDPSDDVIRKRRNAELLQAYTLLHAIAPLAEGELEAMVFGFERTGGEPGPAFQGSEYTHRTLSRYLSALRYSRQSKGSADRSKYWRWQLLGSAAYTRNRFTDLLGEIGLGQRSTDDRSLLTQLRAAAEWRLLPWLDLTTATQWEHDRYAPEDALSPFPVESSDRDHLLATVETLMQGRLGKHRWQVRPSAKLEMISSRLSSIQPETLGVETENLILAPTFRVGGVLELSQYLSLAASGYSSTRAPTMVELFGQRGYLMGNSHLEPEIAVSADVGMNLQGKTNAVQAQAQLRGFVSSIQDLIVYSRVNAQGLYGPRNTDEAFIYGLETSAELSLFEHCWLLGNLTAMHTQDVARDRELPLRQRLQAYVRPEYRITDLGPMDMATLFVDMQYRSSLFSDVTNTVVLPEQWVFGTGVRVWMLKKRLELAGSIRNIFDTTVRDVLAFPLPGRTFSMDMTWHIPF